MSRRFLPISTACVAILFCPKIALAGMPSPHLTDLARLRFETISFFLVVLLLSALVIGWLWNWLRADFPRLPRLTYGKSLAMVVLWGLLAIVVLTMISGARELLTPGAWKKDGLLYKLADEPPEMSQTDSTGLRAGQFQTLKRALWAYALAHEGRFPPERDEFPPEGDAAEVAGSHWEVPTVAGMSYGYVVGRSIGDSQAILAYEPEVFEGARLVLLTDGTVAVMSSADIRTELEQEQQP